MKSILLASASVLGFAGVASAEIGFSGEAELGYNSISGAFSSADMTISMSQELDNGLTAAASVDVGLSSGLFGALDGAPMNLEATGYNLSLTSDTAGLYFGDSLDSAAPMFWAPGSALDGGDLDGFDDDMSGVGIRGEAEMGGIGFAGSAEINTGDPEYLQFSAGGTFGAANVSVAYQDDADRSADLNSDDDPVLDGEAMGIAVGGTFSGFDVTVAYLDNAGATNMGIGLGYTTGPVTLGAYATQDSADNLNWGISAGYDAGNGLTLGAEFDSSDYWEITAGYATGDMTFGASFDSADAWEVTAGYNNGTVAVAASFDSSDAWEIDAGYDLGNGLTVGAGFDSNDAYYIGAGYDLGGGAMVEASYANATLADDGIGEDTDYLEGATVALSFTF